MVPFQMKKIIQTLKNCLIETAPTESWLDKILYYILEQNKFANPISKRISSNKAGLKLVA